jgi:hypothetical protein
VAAQKEAEGEKWVARASRRIRSESRRRSVGTIIERRMVEFPQTRRTALKKSLVIGY